MCRPKNNACWDLVLLLFCFEWNGCAMSHREGIASISHGRSTCVCVYVCLTVWTLRIYKYIYINCRLIYRHLMVSIYREALSTVNQGERLLKWNRFNSCYMQMHGFIYTNVHMMFGWSERRSACVCRWQLFLTLAINRQCKISAWMQKICVVSSQCISRFIHIVMVKSYSMVTILGGESNILVKMCIYLFIKRIPLCLRGIQCRFASLCMCNIKAHTHISVN